MNLYEIKNLTKSYGENESKVLALHNVQLTIEKGQFVVILGASGSGKSTLLNILGGMDTVEKGQVIMEGEDITSYNSRRLTQFRKEKVGFVFQNYNLLPHLTALENVEFSTEIGRHPREAAIKAMEKVGLSHRLHHFPAELSGGEQQRISIARAVAKNPKVLLCDEPTGALDFKTGVMVLKLLKEIHQQENTSVIFITHSQEIAKIANVVIKMRSGEVVDKLYNPSPMDPNEVEW